MLYYGEELMALKQVTAVPSLLLGVLVMESNEFINAGTIYPGWKDIANNGANFYKP